MKETVICAALRYKGQIWYGHRHAHAQTALYDELAWELPRKKIAKDWENVEQGFVTTKGRFVNRSAAYKLQIRAGKQSACKDGYTGLELYSEDLY